MKPSEMPQSVSPEQRYHPSPARGLILMSIGIMLMPLTDGVAKFLSATIPPGEVAWGRFLFQALLTTPIVIALTGWRSLIPKQIWANALRGVLMAGGTTLFFIGLTRIPLADSVAIFFIQPFVLTILAVIFERERVGWRRWLAIAIGFGGAILVIRPSFAEFGPYALLPAISAVSFACFMLLNRRLRGTGGVIAMQGFASIAATVTMTLILVLGTSIGVESISFVAPTATEWGIIAGIGAFAALGHSLMVVAFRYTTPAVLAPTQYLQIISSTAFGFFVFGDFPDTGKWAGIAIIIACGIYIFWRETRRRPR